MKLLIFGLLIGVFWACGGFGLAEERSMRRLHYTFEVTYVVGAVIALWGGREPIGTLQPISLRAIFIALGSILMILSFIAMIAVLPEKRRSTHPAAGNAGFTLQLTLGHHWPGVAELGRSGTKYGHA